jgi:hypothetical protein
MPNKPSDEPHLRGARSTPRDVYRGTGTSLPLLAVEAIYYCTQQQSHWKQVFSMVLLALYLVMSNVDDAVGPKRRVLCLVSREIDS